MRPKDIKWDIEHSSSITPPLASVVAFKQGIGLWGCLIGAQNKSSLRVPKQEL